MKCIKRGKKITYNRTKYYIMRTWNCNPRNLQKGILDGLRKENFLKKIQLYTWERSQ